MTTRTYGQYCPLAQTLDAVGDRWALLVVRELLTGPQRFTDLRGRLPGVGTNQLATRLRELEGEGLVAKHTLPPPAASTVYELTEQGRGLEPAIWALVRFGIPRLHALAPVNTFRPAWAALALRALADRAQPPGEPGCWQVHVEDESFHIIADPRGVTTGPGRAPGPAIAIATDTITAFALARRELTVDQAIEQQLLRCPDTDALHAWAELSGLDRDEPEAAIDYASMHRTPRQQRANIGF